MEGFSDEEIKKRLKEAVGDIQPTDALQEKVRRAVAQTPSPSAPRRWWTLALAALGLAITVFIVYRLTAPPTPETLALQIHTRCAVDGLLARQHQPSQAQMSAFLQHQLPAGQRLADIHLCSWNNVRFTHALLQTGDQVVSLLVLTPQPNMPANRLTLDAPAWPRSIERDGWRLSEATLHQDAIFLVSALPQAQHEALAQSISLDGLPLAVSRAPHQLLEVRLAP